METLPKALSTNDCSKLVNFDALEHLPDLVAYN